MSFIYFGATTRDNNFEGGTRRKRRTNGGYDEEEGEKGPIKKVVRAGTKERM